MIYKSNIDKMLSIEYKQTHMLFQTRHDKKGIQGHFPDFLDYGIEFCGLLRGENENSQGSVLAKKLWSSSKVDF